MRNLNNKKIYLICVDAFPEIDTLTKLLLDRKLSRSDLICSGAFTCATLTSMISGCIGSEIVEGGIGYNTLYKSEFYKWRRDHCIVERLINSGNKVLIHNHVPWFSKVFAGKELTQEEKTKHYRDHTIQQENVKIYDWGLIKDDGGFVYSCTNPDITLNTFLKWNFPDKKAKFYDNEAKYIKYIQEQDFSGMFLTDLCHWHEHVYYKSGQIKSDHEITAEDALKDTIKWLENWNFEEPNSVFFIFADHSHRVNAYLDPPSYMTWVFFKDNIDNHKLNDVIASNDFYKIVETKFNLEEFNMSKWCRNPFTNLENNKRIYAIEDGRSNSEITDKANAFARGSILDEYWISVIKLYDSKNYPAGVYLTITTLKNKYTYTVYYYSNYNLIKWTEVFSVICDGPISERKTFRGVMKHELTSEIMKLAHRLFSDLESQTLVK